MLFFSWVRRKRTTQYSVETRVAEASMKGLSRYAIKREYIYLVQNVETIGGVARRASFSVINRCLRLFR